MNLNNTKFEISAYNKKQIPINNLPVIALLGKSNVGKSSFINAMLNNKNIAKVGNTPGKTRSINFFNIDDTFYIADMPGYGYSKMSKQEKDNINKLVDSYISMDNNIKLFVLLLDIRHKPTTDDRHMYEFLLSTNIDFILVANKLDKIPITKVDEYLKDITSTLFAKEQIYPISSEKKINIDKILNVIISMLK